MTDKKRLEELINRKPSKWSNTTIHEFERDIKILQEQAKRVRELEETNKKNYWIASDFKFENLNLEQQNQRYREALEFYADRKNYKLEHFDTNLNKYKSTVDYDEGHIARQALEEKGV